ncbi:MBL fold metallo-hydrolase [bacterium]
MHIKIIYDNTKSKKSLQSGWGFSCLVDGRILFDTGETSEFLLHNMSQLGVKPQDIESVVISHDHWDHTGGLWELLKQRPGLPVYACPGFGSAFKKKVIALEGKLIKSSEFRNIDSRITVTGEIPGQYKDAPMPEQALLIKSEQGLIVITGCSHPGIVNIVEIIKNKFLKIPISLILGGFHLMDKENAEIQSIVSRLKEMDVHSVAPTHCTGEEAKMIFQKSFPKNIIHVAVGKQIDI